MALPGSAQSRDQGLCFPAVMTVDVFFDQDLEFFSNSVTFQGHGFDTVLVNRRHRILSGSRETDTNVGVLAFAGAIDHAAHYRNLHVFDALIGSLPFRHFVADMALDVLSQLLEVRAGGPSAPRASGDQRKEGTESHGLENFLRDDDFLSPIVQHRFRGQ